MIKNLYHSIMTTLVRRHKTISIVENGRKPMGVLTIICAQESDVIF